MSRISDSEKAKLLQRRTELVELMTNGAKSLSHSDKSITYRSIDEIKTAIAEIDLQLSGKRTRIIKTYANRDL